MCVLLAFISFLIVVNLASGQPILPVDEVNGLMEIAATLGKSDWNFNVDLCSGVSGWIHPNTTKDNTNAVTCDCTYANNTVCHVISIALKAQNLSGTLPPELVKLPCLQQIDLTRNYLNGTIPKEWGSMNLVNISLVANRLNGSIPKELGNISTLANLTLDYNRLTGNIPPEFGNLSSINKLIIQGSGLTGPIPSGIASLTKLTDLRISDLNGIESTFPNLSNIRNLKNLILRSCNIVGELPPYIGDLSFNKLSGPIPENYAGLKEVDFIYLTGNFLTGQVPPWMSLEGKAIDLSYNNFTSEITNCQPRKTNLFASSKGNASSVAQSLKGSCQQSVLRKEHVAVSDCNFSQGPLHL